MPINPGLYPESTWFLAIQFRHVNGTPIDVSGTDPIARFYAVAGGEPVFVCDNEETSGEGVGTFDMEQAGITGVGDSGGVLAALLTADQRGDLFAGGTRYLWTWHNRTEEFGERFIANGYIETALSGGLYSRFAVENSFDGTLASPVVIGATGTDGKTIHLVTAAPSSILGANGDLALNTNTYQLYVKTSGAWGAPVYLTGNQVLNGEGVPAPGTGRDGDFYIDTAADVFYGPKEDGAWPAGIPFPQDVTPELQALLDAAEAARDAALDAQTAAETAETNAETAASAASTSAGAAVNSETDAAGSAADAETANLSAATHDAAALASANRAELAAIAAAAFGVLYPNTTAGLAAKADLEYFTVIGDDANTYAILYQEVSGVAVEKKRFPTLAAIQAFGALALYMTVTGNENSIQIHGITFDPVGTEAAQGYLWAKVDNDRKFLFGVRASDGAFVVGQKIFESVAYNRYLLSDLHVIADDDGNILQSHDRATGRLKAILHPDFLRKTELAADLDPDVAYDAGARGTVSKVRREDQRLISYYSDAPGSTQQILTRTDLDRLRLHMLNTSSNVDIDVIYGQSWATIGANVDAEFDMSIGKYIKDPDTEREIVFGVANTSLTSHITTIIDTGAGVNLPANMDDLLGWQLSDRSYIHTSRAIALARWRRWRRSGLKPQVQIGIGYPGSGWTAGGPDGNGLGTSGVVLPKMIAVTEAAEAAATRYGKTAARKSLCWIQSGGNNTEEESLTNLQAMHDEMIDVLGFENVYIGIRGNKAQWTETAIGPRMQVQFCQENVSGRAWADYPWYMAELKSGFPEDENTEDPEGAGDIHFGGDWQVIYGEYSAYVKHMVEDLGYDATHETPWCPLQLLEADDDAIVIDGQHVTCRFKRPPGPDWVVSELALSDLVEPAQYDGFRVKRGAVFLTITDIEYSGDADYLYAEFDVTQTLAGGGATEISYCYYGPGAVGHSGVWGNIMLPGPPTVVSKIQSTFCLPLLPFGRTFTL